MRNRSFATSRFSAPLALALAFVLASCTDPHPTYINPREAVIAAAAAQAAPMSGGTMLATSAEGVAGRMALYKWRNQCDWKFDPQKSLGEVFHQSVFKALDAQFAELSSGPRDVNSAEEAAQSGRTIFARLEKVDFIWSSGRVSIDFRADLHVLDDGRSVLERQVVAQEAGVEGLAELDVKMLWGVKALCDQEAEWLSVAFQYGLKRIVEEIRQEIANNRDALSGSSA